MNAEFPISLRWILLLLIAPTIAMAAMVLFSTFFGQYFRRPCPACMKRGLKKVSFVRAESIIEGIAQPDYRTYLRCDFCGSRFKLHDGILSGVPEDEMTEATKFG